MASIQPKTDMLRSISNQGMRWHKILGEFIDNSFDANSSRILFAFGKGTLRIEDDGVGCEDVLKMLTIGDRSSHSSTQLGCYGIGAKDAAISAADEISIRSVHGGVRRFVACNWKRLRAKDSWDIDDPTECPAMPDEKGTMIHLSGMKSKPSDFDRLVETLSLLYSPAIEGGRQIVIQNGKKAAVTVPIFSFPPLEHQTTADIAVDGRKARVRMGIIPEGTTVTMSGLVVSCGYRVITKDSRIGLGDSPTPNLFGWLELQDGWELTKHKDNVSSNMDTLGTAIYERCKDTIERASKAASSVIFSGVEKCVNEALEGLMESAAPQKRKAKRKSAENTSGAAAPTGRGGKHKRAKRSQPGETFVELGDTHISKLRVSFASLGKDAHASKFASGVVYLNKDIPIITDSMSIPDAIAVHAIYSAASYLALADGPQRRLFETHGAEATNEKTALIAGMLLSRMKQSVT